jgi:hypothetical protein
MNRLKERELRQLITALALNAALASPVVADTAGPGEMAAWMGCPLETLRITETLPPNAWVGTPLNSGMFYPHWNEFLTPPISVRPEPPREPALPPVALPASIVLLLTGAAALMKARKIF